jgi:Fe-S-cluster containining protein
MNFEAFGRRAQSFAMLPILTNCEACGACCMEQGAPPDYVALSVNPHLGDDPSFAEDVERLGNLPAQAAELLAMYLRESQQGTRDQNGWCVWFDGVSKSCRFYDWRPSTCRVFELGSPGCRIYRRRQGIDDAEATGFTS